MQNLFIKNDLEYLKVINGRWTINGKTFSECTFNEQKLIWEKSLNL